MVIPPDELERLHRTVRDHPGDVAIRYRGGPLDGMISHTSLENWRWANITGWCVRDEGGRVVQILYRRSADHAQVYEFDSMSYPGGSAGGYPAPVNGKPPAAGPGA